MATVMNCTECPWNVVDILNEGAKLKSGRCMLATDKNPACMDHKKYTVYMIWGKIHAPNVPEIKITACSTRKAAESFIKHNSQYYDNMHIVAKEV